MCPKLLKEIKTPQRNVTKVGGKKIEFAKIVQKIVSSGQYWTVSEVQKTLVENKVCRLRTMHLLNGAATTKKLDRVYSEGKFFYGPMPTAPVAPTTPK